MGLAVEEKIVSETWRRHEGKDASLGTQLGEKSGLHWKRLSCCKSSGPLCLTSVELTGRDGNTLRSYDGGSGQSYTGRCEGEMSGVGRSCLR